MTGFSINQLKAAITDRGPAFANRYQVMLPTMTEIGEKGESSAPRPADGQPKEIPNFFCRSTNMPGKQILSVDRNVNGTIQKIAYGQASEDVSMTFQTTEDLYIKRLFEYWQQQAFDMYNGIEHYKPLFKDTYVHDVAIYQMNRGRGIKTYGIKLIDAYPTTVNQVSYNDQGELVEISVQLSYKKWMELEDEFNSGEVTEGYTATITNTGSTQG
mgnify:FL=1